MFTFIYVVLTMFVIKSYSTTEMILSLLFINEQFLLRARCLRIEEADRAGVARWGSGGLSD